MTGGNIQPTPTPFRVLVLGGSYGGLATILDLLDLGSGVPTRPGNRDVTIKCQIPVEITLVDERSGFFHLIGAPLALTEERSAFRFWVEYKDIPALHRQEVRIIQGAVKSVDHRNMSASIAPHGEPVQINIAYDYLVAATGFRRAWPTVPQAFTRDSYLEEALGHVRLIADSRMGAVGIETAAEIKVCYPEIEVSLIHSRDHLLSAEPLPSDFGDQAVKALVGMRVKVILGKRVVRVTKGSEDGIATNELSLSDGTTMRVSHVISALSRPVPTGAYLPREALNQDREVVVRSSLQFAEDLINSDCHFAIGDMAAWPPNSAPVIKRCGAAMYHGNVAAFNIFQHMSFQLDLIARPVYRTLPIHKPVIGLALGKTALGYSSENGITSGKELHDAMFGDDLGFTLCWNHLGLGKGQ